MKRVITILYIIGLITICAFYTPIFTTPYYDHPRRIIFSHIFSTQGDIIILRLLLYFILWTSICLATFSQFKDFKFKKKIKWEFLKKIKYYFNKLDFKYNLTGNKEYLEYKAKFRQAQKAEDDVKRENFKRRLEERFQEGMKANIAATMGNTDKPSEPL